MGVGGVVVTVIAVLVVIAVVLTLFGIAIDFLSHMYDH